MNYKPLGRTGVQVSQLCFGIRVALTRIELGNFSSIKWIDGNLGEFRLDFGPGYRIYLTRYATRHKPCERLRRLSQS